MVLQAELAALAKQLVAQLVQLVSEQQLVADSNASEADHHPVEYKTAAVERSKLSLKVAPTAGPYIPMDMTVHRPIT